MRVFHYFEMVSEHAMSLIRIRVVIMFLLSWQYSMAHFTFSYANPRISIYNTETNMVWNIECFSPLLPVLVVTLIFPSMKVFSVFLRTLNSIKEQ